MAKQSNQKLKLLYLLRILLEQTDGNSGLTLSEISKELAKYNISAARKSLYDDIEALRVFGIDVCVKRDRYVRYYIGKREISFVELRYITDAIEQFAAIDPEVAHTVSVKIMTILGIKGKGNVEKDIPSIAKMPRVISEEQEKNIDIITTAILNNKKNNSSYNSPYLYKDTNIRSVCLITSRPRSCSSVISVYILTQGSDFLKPCIEISIRLLNLCVHASSRSKLIFICSTRKCSVPEISAIPT